MINDGDELLWDRHGCFYRHGERMLDHDFVLYGMDTTGWVDEKRIDIRLARAQDGSTEAFMSSVERNSHTQPLSSHVGFHA